jgi:hypothetical protein
MKLKAALIAGTGLAVMATAGAGASLGAHKGACVIPKGSERVRLDPGGFTTRITNPWWPMKPGSRWLYRETDPEGSVQRGVVTVLAKTKLVANGVTARVVRDVATEDGKPVEATNDYYAQDRCGNVWYLGEATTEYKNGKPVSTKGSFEAGVDGAQAGVIVPGRPKPGMGFRQEYLAGQAEDRGEIVSLREQAEVPFGHFGRGRVLMTRDLNPLEPKTLEFKFYARGVGPVLAIGISGGADREELVRYTHGG